MKSNILLVGLDYDFVKSVAVELSGLFDMHYLDIKNLISYNLIDEQNVLEVAGINYYKSQVNKIVLSSVDYENTIINIPYDLYLQLEISKELNKSCVTIFINLEQKIMQDRNKELLIKNQNHVAMIAFDELSLLLKQNTQLQVNANKNVFETTNNILQLLKNINLSELK